MPLTMNAPGVWRLAIREACQAVRSRQLSSRGSSTGSIFILQHVACPMRPSCPSLHCYGKSGVMHCCVPGKSQEKSMERGTMSTTHPSLPFFCLPPLLSSPLLSSPLLSSPLLLSVSSPSRRSCSEHDRKYGERTQKLPFISRNFKSNFQA
eukprot:755949-Hanusia_phi.AAC.6